MKFTVRDRVERHRRRARERRVETWLGSRRLCSLGIGMGLALTGTRMAAAAAAQPLMVVTYPNAINNSVLVLTSPVLSFGMRVPFVVGSGTISEFVQSWHNFYQQLAGYTLPGNSVLIDSASIEIATPGVAVAPVYFGNPTRSLTLANGDADIQSDAFALSALGVATLARGSTGFCKILGHLTATGNLVVNRSSVLETGAQAFAYDPARTTVSTVDATGVFLITPNPDAQTDLSNLFAPIMLGRFVV